MPPDMLLEAKSVAKHFGGLIAVQDVDYEIPEQSISAIIGPNGAGKTTFFNLMTGIYKVDEGTITFGGKSLVGLRPDQINRIGLARTFQNIRLFSTMSVIENVLVGLHTQLNIGLSGPIFRTQAFNQQERDAQRKVEALLDFVGLSDKANEIARNLPYGDQRRLEIARALASSPKLLLLDEPTAGMNPHETAEAMALFRRVRDEQHITVLLIEHDMRVVMGISERIMVLNYGKKLAEGRPDEIRRNQEVVDAYLGKGAAH